MTPRALLFIAFLCLSMLPALDLGFETQWLFRKATAVVVEVNERRVYMRDPEGGGRESLITFATLEYPRHSQPHHVLLQVSEDFWVTFGQYAQIRNTLKAGARVRVWVWAWRVPPWQDAVLLSKGQLVRWYLVGLIGLPIIAMFFLVRPSNGATEDGLADQPPEDRLENHP